jgi:hypothetical protein
MRQTDFDRARNAEFVQFSRLNRVQRLAALKAAQQTQGLDSPFYSVLPPPALGRADQA